MTGPSDNLQATLDALIGRHHVRNVVAAIRSHDRRLDLAGAAGVADPATGTAMTVETPYFIASITKMYTATIVLQLHGEGMIRLSEPVSAYLPPRLVSRIHVYKGTDHSPRITIWELLCHTSGLADYEADRPRGESSVLDDLKSGHDRCISLEEAIDITRRLTPRFPPGAPGKAYYSNTNYRLLGALIESVTGKPMAHSFDERIFAPLGLQHTYLFDWAAPRDDQDPATIYLGDAPADVPRYLSSNVADGGLVSTAHESLEFLQAFFEGRLFSKTLLERTMDWNRIFFPLRYGCGLMCFRLPRFFSLRRVPEFVGHSGSTGSFAFTCPSRALYLAGTVNQIVSPARPFFLMLDIVRAVS